MTGSFYRQFIRINYIFGLSLIIAFLPHSKIMLSIGQFWLACAFAIERYNTGKWIGFFHNRNLISIAAGVIPMSLFQFILSLLRGFRAFLSNRPAVAFSSIYLMLFAGLLFTTDFGYAFKDIRTKVPLLLMPLFIGSTSAFNRREFYGFMFLYVAAVLVRTLMNSWNLFNGYYVDIRDISRSISHIIVALHVAFAVFLLGYFIFRKKKFPVWLRIIFGMILIWFLVYPVIADSTTGVVITCITFLILCIIIFSGSRKLWLKTAVLGIVLITVGASIFYISGMVCDFYKVKPIDLQHLDKVSKLGNPYIPNTSGFGTENGNYLYIYIQPDELREAWSKRSSVPINGMDKKGQELGNTLVRYLTSKGLRKDAGGVGKLTDADVHAIENGIANVIYTWSFSLRGEVYMFLRGLDEYRNTGDPTGSSVMQRVEFWRASTGIIRDHWLTGVGTGDMNEAFQRQYELMHTKLAPSQRWRSHNQFLSVFVGFGIFGLIWFLFALLYPPVKLHRFRDYFFLVFFIIAILSMMPEDTIESQMGVTFVAFFYSFLLFGRKEEETFLPIPPAPSQVM